jgi:chorismate mutase
MNNLEEIRKEIDVLDDQIIALLEERLSLIQKIKKDPKKLTDSERENFILNKCPSSFSKNVYRAIFKGAKKIEKTNNK